MAEEKSPETEDELKPAVPETPEGGQELAREEEGPKRFVERGPHVIHDTETGLFWMKKDSWQDRGKFFNWHESKDYADKKNVRKVGGFDDWRMPTSDEAATLYNPNLTNTAKGGDTIHIDPVFPEGAFKMEWTMADTSTRRPRYDYTQGKVVNVDEYAFGSVRLVRKDSGKRDDTRVRSNQRR